MNTAPDLSLYDALLRCGRLDPDQRVAAERLFTEHATDPTRLAEKLLAGKFVTKYMARKIQTGRASELLFGQYLILERIGEGGMGKVYRAIGSRLGQEVALKTIRPNLLANKTVVQRYKREARAAAALEHPNIVKLFEADDVGGRYFLAMEFVDGSDLSRLVKDLNKERAFMPPGEAAEYIRQAALGLQHAHDKGLVHRDIKPSNLLVSGERAIPGTGGKAMVKILDMGLVRSLADDDDVNSTELTRDGTVVGTPDYMSPEQSRNSSTVDPRADLYSLGCTLFYLLRGLPPYSSGTAIDKLIKHQLDPIPDIRQYRPDVPPGLAAVIKKMMAKKPEDRYQTADEVARELTHFTGDRPLDAAQLPHLLGELAGLPSLDDTPAAAPAATSRGGFQTIDLAPPGGTTPPPAQPVAVPPAPAPATESGVRSVIRPVVRPANPSAASPASPPSGQRTVRVVSQAKPIPKPSADATTPESTDIPTRPRRGTDRRAKRPPTKKPAGGFPVMAVVAAGVGGVALIVVLAVLLALSGKDDTVTPTTAAPPTTPTPPTTQKSPFRPAVELLPDDTAAVLVVDPKAYWELARPEVETTTNARRQVDTLDKWARFDPRRFDRVVVGFHADMGRRVAIGEGEVLKGSAFRDGLKQLPWAEVEPSANGTMVVRTKLPGKANQFNPPARAVRAALVADPPAYLLAVGPEGRADLADLYKHAQTRKGPAFTDARLLAAVTDATAAGTPLVFFAATADCRLPLDPKGKAEPMSAFGVDLLTLTVANADAGQARVTLTLNGADKARLDRFAERQLAGLLEGVSGREQPGVLADPLTEALKTAAVADAGGRKQLTITFFWPWTAIHPAVDKFLGPPSEK
ncbi:MAG: serine/threonine protein kinase [Fimbriiglobus sp.]|jgi:serine/threonine-protein kinase|nr:serine/threonine protein kinase [Fimbriiglobus sp.]